MMGAGLSLDEAQEFMKDFIIRRGRLGVRLALLSLGKRHKILSRNPHVACKVLMITCSELGSTSKSSHNFSGHDWPLITSRDACLLSISTIELSRPKRHPTCP